MKNSICICTVPDYICNLCFVFSICVSFSFFLCMHISVHLQVLLYFLFGVSMVSFGFMYISGQFI